MPVKIISGASVTIDGKTVTVTGPKGNLSFVIPEGIAVAQADDVLTVSQREVGSMHTRALFGLTRAQIANMVKGVTEGFERKLEMVGVGYRAQAAGNTLTLSLGFSHPVKIVAPAGITFQMAESTIIVSGSDKAVVGNIAAKVRSLRKPEPYKGKGIRYLGEYIRRKAGKAAKAVGGK